MWGTTSVQLTVSDENPYEVVFQPIVGEPLPHPLGLSIRSINKHASNETISTIGHYWNKYIRQQKVKKWTIENSEIFSIFQKKKLTAKNYETFGLLFRKIELSEISSTNPSKKYLNFWNFSEFLPKISRNSKKHILSVLWNFRYIPMNLKSSVNSCKYCEIVKFFVWVFWSFHIL